MKPTKEIAFLHLLLNHFQHFFTHFTSIIIMYIPMCPIVKCSLFIVLPHPWKTLVDHFRFHVERRVSACCSSFFATSQYVEPDPAWVVTSDLGWVYFILEWRPGSAVSIVPLMWICGHHCQWFRNWSYRAMTGWRHAVPSCFKCNNSETKSAKFSK